MGEAVLFQWSHFSQFVRKHSQNTIVIGYVVIAALQQIYFGLPKNSDGTAHLQSHQHPTSPQICRFHLTAQPRRASSCSQAVEGLCSSGRECALHPVPHTDSLSTSGLSKVFECSPNCWKSSMTETRIEMSALSPLLQ